MSKYDPSANSPRRQVPSRHPCIAHLDEIEPGPHVRKQEGIAVKSWDIGEATGAQLIGVDVTEIPPGKKSARLHWHSHKEEFFFVLSGRCHLRLGEKEFALNAGDAVSRPAGTGVPHQFHNPYDEPCRVMMLGVQSGKGVADTVEYPELGIAMIVNEDGKREMVKRQNIRP